MAKLNKVEQARQDGMDYAYRLAKEKGLEALEMRVQRNRKTFAPAFQGQEQIDEFSLRVKDNTITTFMAILLMVMRDKWGFGKERLKRLSEQIRDLAESIEGEWLTYEDIYLTLEQEIGMNLIDWTNAKEVLLNMDNMLANARRNENKEKEG